jgi:hypothetical protein
MNDHLTKDMNKEMKHNFITNLINVLNTFGYPFKRIKNVKQQLQIFILEIYV